MSNLQMPVVSSGGRYLCVAVFLTLSSPFVHGSGALCAQPAPAGQAAAADPVLGNWRGTLRSAQGAETPFIVTLIKRGDGYGGTTTGLAESGDVALDTVTVTGASAVIEVTADSKLGRVALKCELTAEGNRMSGTGTLAVGGQRLDVVVALQRRQRQDVVQPHVDQRADYFVGKWSFEYLGGEFPPLSQGTRTGTVTFARVGSSTFVSGVLEGDLGGSRYREELLLGVDAATKMMVWRERRADGLELVSLGNWQSPLAIAFLTSPLASGGKSFQLRRVISVTSDVAFAVTEEFSVDGGPFRRLGRAQFAKVP